MNLFGTLIEQSLLYVPLVVGAYIDIGLMKVPDLALSSAFTFGAITATKVLPFCSHFPQPVALCIVITASLLGGMIVGLISSTLTQRAGFSHLLSSIITEGLFHGINQMTLGSSNCSLSGYKNPLSLPFMNNHPELILLFFLGALLSALTYALLKTPLGYAFGIYGSNPRFFNHHPISLPFVFTSGIMLSNGLAGISGYCFAQSNGFVDINMGVGIPLFAITALLLGKTLSKLTPLLAAFGGLVIYFLLQQLLLRVGFNLNYFTLVQSFLILLVLLVYQRRNKTVLTGDLGV
jgi:putative ABC transport system permease protein